MDLQALTESLKRIISIKEELTVEAKRVQQFLDEVELQLTKANVIVPVYVPVTSGLYSLGWDRLENEPGFALVWSSSGITADMARTPLASQPIEHRALAAQQIPRLFQAIEEKLASMRHNIQQAFPPQEGAA